MVPFDSFANNSFGDRRTATIPNEEIIDNHKQLSDYSCIPMTVELVLKLLGLVPTDYFDFQIQWNNSKTGNFSHFDGQTFQGITFRYRFFVARGKSFPLKQLFKTIDYEIGEGRYVVASLSVGINYHNFVIYDQTADGEYEAVSKVWSDTWWRSDAKQEIIKMTGTDILIYEVSTQAATQTY